ESRRSEEAILPPQLSRFGAAAKQCREESADFTEKSFMQRLRGRRGRNRCGLLRWRHHFGRGKLRWRRGAQGSNRFGIRRQWLSAKDEWRIHFHAHVVWFGGRRRLGFVCLNARHGLGGHR